MASTRVREGAYAPSPDEAADELRKLLPKGTTVRTILRRVSRSGMMRHISLVVVHDGDIRDITWHAANVLDERVDDSDGGILVGGAGMDMGFHLVYNLSYVLYDRDGYALNHRWL